MPAKALTTESTAEQTTADVTAAPGETQKEAETETEAAKNPLPQEDIDLNNAYLALQDFAMKKLENKELAEADVMQLMNIGVDLAYLKEARRRYGKQYLHHAGDKAGTV